MRTFDFSFKIWQKQFSNNQVVCRQLGYTHTDIHRHVTINTTRHDYWVEKTQCIGNETRIENCSHEKWNITDWWEHNHFFSWNLTKRLKNWNSKDFEIPCSEVFLLCVSISRLLYLPCNIQGRFKSTKVIWKFMGDPENGVQVSKEEQFEYLSFFPTAKFVIETGMLKNLK